MVAFSRLLTGVLTFASASIALAAPTGNATLVVPIGLSCGADTPPVANLAAADESKLVVDPSSALVPVPNRIVNVYWNVIYKDTTYAGGYLSSTHAFNSISALNAHYASAGMTFRLMGMRWYKNLDWFDKADNQAGNVLTTAMKNLLHRGTARDLNVYSVGFSTTSLGGFATFPWWYAGAPLLDGVVFKWNTTPGGSLPNYTQGKILTHEVGHWAGLYHTFQGGCSDTAGDYVSDTPAEAEPAFGCPASRDSCPGLPGLDPLSNYMDYTYDTCKNNFTPGQIARMKLAMSFYRST